MHQAVLVCEGNNVGEATLVILEKDHDLVSENKELRPDGHLQDALHIGVILSAQLILCELIVLLDIEALVEEQDLAALVSLVVWALTVMG